MKFFPRSYSTEAGTPSRSLLRHCALTALGATLLALASHSAAQITAPSGAQPQDGRTSATGDSPNTAASGVHEGYAPQSKDAKGNGRGGSTAGKGAKPAGATGFDNGLYGTGAGSNK
ncbi:MAG: hypothetical protein QOI13_386 [Paraburkholderia sp.]|nr:hypothetical protein [Paraburkholderia sp.]